MVEELKAQMRRLENLIGFEGKMDVTSRAFTQELIRALDTKYKDDVKNSLRLHQLEFYHDLIESARHKQRKSADVEEKFLLEEEKEKKDDDDEEEVEEQVKEKELFKKPEGVVAIKAENIDEWKDLMTLSRIYYVLEHPNSAGIAWKRRISKKKSISKFSDKDLIEWRVGENFKLRGLEEWALSRSEAKKVLDKSPYDFDDLLEDDESRELEDMFNILDTQKQKKRKVGQLEKSLKSNRPFKFKDEGVEDWTESYSDDSEESGMEDMTEEILEIDEEPDFKVDDYKMSSEEESINEEETIWEIFSVYERKPGFRNPALEEMDKAETMERWFDLCQQAIGSPDVKTPETPPVPKILFTIEEGEDEEYLPTEIPDDIGYIRGEEIPVEEAKEKDIERPGDRIPVKEVKEEDIEKPGDDSVEPPILAPYQGERMHIKEATEKAIERPGGRIPVKEAREKDIEKLAGTVPEPDAKDVDLVEAATKQRTVSSEKQASKEKFKTTSKTQASKKKSFTPPERPSQKALRHKLKDAESRSSRKLPQDAQKDLETSEKRKPKSKTNIKEVSSIMSDSLGEFDFDDIYDEEPSEETATHEAAILSVQDEQRVGEGLKSIIEKGKVDALEEQEKEYKERRATLPPDEPDAQGQDLESVLRRESTQDETKSGKDEKPPEVDESVAETVTISLGHEDKVEKTLKSTANEAKAIALRRQEEDSGKDEESPLSGGSSTMQDSLGEFDLDDTYGIETTEKLSIDQPAIRRVNEQRVGERKKSKEKPTHPATISKEDEQRTGKREKSKETPTQQATISMHDEQSLGEHLKSIIDEGKVDALEEKEKEYKKRRATLSTENFDAQGTDLESVLKRESRINVTKSGSVKDEKSPEVDKSVAGTGTLSLGDEDKVGKALKSTVDEAKQAALSKKDSGSSERTKKRNSRSNFRKSK